MSIHVETVSEARPLGRISDLLRSAFSRFAAPGGLGGIALSADPAGTACFTPPAQPAPERSNGSGLRHLGLVHTPPRFVTIPQTHASIGSAIMRI